MSAELPIRRLDAAATMPTRAHPGDAGLDLYALESASVAPGEGGLLRTGVAVAVPHGHVGLVCDRSSLARRGLKTAGGVIDAGYRGELGVVVWNLSGRPQEIKAGERCAQLLIVPIATPAPVEHEELDATARGAGGFGSTGR
jgi:dUTP pyrophosphatase